MMANKYHDSRVGTSILSYQFIVLFVSNTIDTNNNIYISYHPTQISTLRPILVSELALISSNNSKSVSNNEHNAKLDKNVTLHQLQQNIYIHSSITSFGFIFDTRLSRLNCLVESIVTDKEVHLT